jgi:hypothetical protein
MAMDDSRASSALMREAWTALGGDPGDLDRVKLEGDSAGLLPSRLAVIEMMTAAVGAATLAVSALDAAREARPSTQVSLDVEHVAVAARSERYARLLGSDLRMGMAPLSRFWNAADGWIRLHTNYPWHLRRALGVLGCDDAPEAVGAAIAGRSATELEESLAAAGALGFAVRSLRDWRLHPQGEAVAGQPLVRTAVGAGPARRLPPGRALDGVRVLDLTRVIAGPVATRTLAAWGADILRVDAPQLPEVPAQAIDTLQGKHSTLLDLFQPSARARLEELLAEADLVVQGYRPGALARFELTAEHLAERWPHLGVVTISAWGRSGPWSGRRGFDSLVQCPTGIAAIEGDAAAPGILPAQALDHATGYLAAAAATMSLAASHIDGMPRSHEVSLARTATWLTDAGTADISASRAVDPAPFLAVLPGDGFSVEVVRPPGGLEDRFPRWRHTTAIGADPATFTGRGAG